MTIWWLAVILAGITAAGLAFIWLAVRLGRLNSQPKKLGTDSLLDMANQEVEHIFNQEFREELRNRGRLHFEKIIGENAMFLQQDLRLTTSQLNEYMKKELSQKLTEEFNHYQESISDAQKMAVESMDKTKEAIEEQRQVLTVKLNDEIEAERARLLKRFEDNMADIVNHYVMEAVGRQIDLSDQLEYILGELDNNKQAILEDIRHGS